MRKTIISLILLMTPLVPALAAEASAIKEDAPDRYTVQRGDTLWSISGRFLKDPWKWPEVWKMNQEQVKNPHRIYPGDVIVLDRTAGGAQLRLMDSSGGSSRGETVKLSPRARVEPLKDGAVPTIPPSAIEPFLSRPLIVGADELDSTPTILATEENRVAIGAGSLAYVEGLNKEEGTAWQIFRRGDALIDPDSNEILGYQAIYLGEARVLKFGPQSTIEITKSAREIYAGDRLISAAKIQPTYSYVPRAPLLFIRARIVSAYGSLGETGPAGIVALSRGAQHGLEVGHVLAIYRSQSTSRYELRSSPLWGTQGPTGNEQPRTYHSEQITPRDSPMYETSKAISPSEIAALPDERYGLVMVFRTFDRASYGLVMKASRPVSVNDIVTNP